MTNTIKSNTFIERKEKRKIETYNPQSGAKGKRFNPSGKHRKQTKEIIKWIESLGFEFVSQRDKVVYKHPEWKCSILFSQTSSDTNAPAAMVQSIRKVLKSCDPPFDIDKIPENINRMRLVGKMDVEEKELTMGDVLDSFVVDYDRVSTEMTADGKQELKSLAETKGITMGELIEEMMIVYKDKQ